MTAATQQLVKSWFNKAQRDLASAHILAASDPPLLDTALYHCQQAAEKAVKGSLVYCEQEFARVHDLDILLRAAIPHASGFAAWLEAGRLLTPYATLHRYPSPATEPNKEQYDQAVAAAEGIYNFALSLTPAELRPQ